MREIFKSKKFWITTAVIAVVYLCVIAFLMNRTLLLSTWEYPYPFRYKFDLSWALFRGLVTSNTPFDLTMLVLNALLTGANLFLVWIKVTQLHKFGTVTWFSLGGSVLGVLSAGCAACGLPIISLVGITSAGALAYFDNTFFLLLSFVLLLVSFYYLAKSIVINKCKI